MKNLLFSIVGGLLIVLSLSCQPLKNQLITKTFQADTTSLIRNPGMGWTIYDDASGPVADAVRFWELQDTIARKYATTLYIRWRWSDMEPEEGKYAWEHDPNFKALVKGALDRGLKLAFRVYVASQDNEYESTPGYVFNAGARYYMEKGKPGDVRSPFPDDPIFQEKFEAFIKAFSEKFDDASVVNYVDGYNLGWWGEGHHLTFIDETKKEATFKWIVDLYGSHFKNVPLVITVDSQIGHELEKKYAINANGFSVRRDGYASTWMPERQKKLLQGLFPKSFIVAECCYWQDRTIESVNEIEQVYNWDSWGGYYTQVVDEALETHANYLDLREPVEAIRWTSEANNDVKRFVQKGGYRIYPTKVSYSKSVSVGDSLSIEHVWTNLGVGVLPNNSKAWNYKYKVAFALRDEEGNVCKQWLSNKAEPSDWINEAITKSVDNFLVDDLMKGKYSLSVAILNTNTNKAEIELAVFDEMPDGWLFIGNIELR